MCRIFKHTFPTQTLALFFLLFQRCCLIVERAGFDYTDDSTAEQDRPIEKELKDLHHTIEHHELQIEEGMRPTTKSNEKTTEKIKWNTSGPAQKNATSGPRERKDVNIDPKISSQFKAF